ncbi:MAG: LysR substrate-binding domain-containing protein [Betaproteobacteria bacterium]|jgi:aminoethylphosphonate catabolism LysR family transcriptional regulator
MDTSSSAELRAFDATFRTGSMSAAANLLGIRQPTVSAHIANLERQFGSDLFVRHGRGLQPTEMARRLAEITSRISRAEDDAALLLASVRSQYEGTLRVCAIGPYNVMPIIAAFRAKYPRIRIAMTVGDSRSVVRSVTDHQQDVGLILHAVEDTAIHCVPFRRQPLVVFAEKHHPLATRGSVDLQLLDGHEFVLREEGSQTRKVFEAGMRDAGIRIRCAIEVGSRESVREAVAQRLGLGIVAKTAFVPDPRLVALDVRGLTLATHVHLICLAERKSDALVERFLQTAELLKPDTQPDTNKHR